MSEENPLTNKVLKAIKCRRSIRSYKPEPVPDMFIEKIIDAGNWAPSAGNLQPWRFVVVKDKKVRAKLREATVPKWRNVMELLKEEAPERYKMFKNNLKLKDPVFYSAPVIIFIIGTSSINCSLACQNILLAAHSLGLGSCYVGWGSAVLDCPEIIEILELKADESIFGPIIIGYSEEYPKPPKKKKPEVKFV
jgi:nitroreductase